MAKRRLVVIGNGMGGARAVENVLARGGADLFEITIFGDEPYGNYNRIMLSGILDGTKQEDDILLNPLAWYAENGVRLHAGRRVESIDRAAKFVTADDGSEQPYDLLVIATGSRAFIPPFVGALRPDGALKPGLFGYRTLDDCRNIAAGAARSSVAATVGGGLLGLEVARSMMVLGCRSHIVHLAPHLLNVQLDAVGGAMLAKTMLDMGLHVHTGKATAEILGTERVEGLRFKDGTDLPCDVAVIAAGVRPNAEIGLRAGLTVERAIVVNDHMQSVDDMSVYAVGECAQHRGRVYGLVAPVWDQARVFADHVTERDRQAAYHGSRLSTKLKVMGVEVASMGITDPVEDHDEVVQFSEPKRGTYKKLILRHNRIVGGILMGEISKAAYLMQAFDRNSPLPEDRAALLFDIGGVAPPADVAAMPDDVQVCNCGGVSKATIGAAVKRGCRDPGSVMEATRAGMGCGSCKGQVGALVEWFCAQGQPEPPPDPGLRMILDDGLAVTLQADGTLSVMAEGSTGCTPDLLARVAGLAIKLQAGGIRLSTDRIDLTGLPAHEIEGLRTAVFDPAE